MVINKGKFFGKFNIVFVPATNGFSESYELYEESLSSATGWSQFPDSFNSVEDAKKTINYLCGE